MPVVNNTISWVYVRNVLQTYTKQKILSFISNFTMESALSQKLDFNKLQTLLPNANIEMPMDVFNVKKIFIWVLTENATHMRQDVCLTIKENALDAQFIKDMNLIKTESV